MPVPMRFVALLVLFLSGIIGGAVSHRFTTSVASASHSGQHLEASLIKITDGTGRVRGMFGIVDSKPQLKLIDEAGRERFIASVDGNGVGITLNTPAGKPSINLTSGNDYNSFVAINNNTGAPTIVSGVKDGAPMTVYLDHQSKPKITIGVASNGNVSLTMYGQAGRIGSDLGIVGKEPHLYLVGANDKSKVAIQMNNGLDPLVGLFDNNGVARSILAISDQIGSHLSFYNERGSARAMFANGIQNGSVLNLVSDSGTTGFMAYARKNQNGVGIFNDNGREGVIVQTDANGSVLGFRDSQQKMRAVAGIRNDKPWIGVLDPAGAPVWGGPGPAPNLPPTGDLDAAIRDLLR